MLFKIYFLEIRRNLSPEFLPLQCGFARVGTIPWSASQIKEGEMIEMLCVCACLFVCKRETARSY